MHRINTGGMEITDFCNLKCLHCYVGEIGRAKIHMPYEKICYLIEEFIVHDARKIVLSGGEPFLHPKISAILCDMKTKYSKSQFVITSNGSLITKTLIDEIKSIPNLTLQISLDGATKETHELQHGAGTFEHLMRLFAWMKSIPRTRKIIRMCISKINYREISQVIKIAEKYDFDIAFSFLSRVGKAEANWAFLEMSLAQKMVANETVLRYSQAHPEKNILPPQSVLSCPFDDDNYVISTSIGTTGDVNICTCLGREYIIGNIFEKGLEPLLFSQKCRDITKRVKARKKLLKTTVCKNCVISPQCGQGCIGLAKRAGNEIGLDGECEYRMAQLFKNRFLYGKG